MKNFCETNDEMQFQQLKYNYLRDKFTDLSKAKLKGGILQAYTFVEVLINRNFKLKMSG